MFTIWITGLSASGKTTLAENIKDRLAAMNHHAYVVDGDEVRKGISHCLGFSREDVRENVRRVAEIARILNEAGVISIVSLISPYREDRGKARSIIRNFVEVFVDCQVEVCECRDPKGLYKKARAGEISGFAGVDTPYEKPDNPDIHVNSAVMPIQQSVDKVIDYLRKRQLI